MVSHGDHLWSSTVDVCNWETIVLVFFCFHNGVFVSDCRNSSILTWWQWFWNGLWISLLHCMCLSTTHQCLEDWYWPVCASVGQGDSWKGCIWQLERDLIRKMARFSIFIDLLPMLKIQPKRVPLEQPFCKIYPTWVRQSQLRWLGEIGLSVMCSTLDVVLHVKRWSEFSYSFTFFLVVLLSS